VLARALTACSLAGQPDLRERLREWPASALWMTGARDAKFVAIARELERAGTPATFVTCAEAGHRVPWDNPPAFAAALQEWIAR
jgi:2-succinyl-6-hydroxy-2,4-cyclohexadiene-1-carboxylate synthase